MAGARISFELQGDAEDRLSEMLSALDDVKPLLANIREYLISAHDQRFKAQQAPDGTPWAPLSPRYQRSKKENAGRILVLRGYLKTTLRGVINDEWLEFGTDRKYGAIHQFGGEIKHKARSTSLFFRKNSDGTVGNRFVKRKLSNFAQSAQIGDHMTTIPARPWLGTSAEDNDYIVGMAAYYIQREKS